MTHDTLFGGGHIPGLEFPRGFAALFLCFVADFFDAFLDTAAPGFNIAGTEERAGNAWVMGPRGSQAGSGSRPPSGDSSGG
ncbi:MAG: hypothetical protein EA427_06110, partial [Spirochaetaceae bacterium]